MIDAGTLKTPSIVEAFRKVDRVNFVVDEYRDLVYQDMPLPTLQGQTISQPSTVAFIIELLSPKKGEKILDVGAGSGWTTALLACITREKDQVYGVERIPELVQFSNDNIKKVKSLKKLPTVFQADKRLGLPDIAPFDKILVAATAISIPDELVAQLKVGGRLVIPVDASVWKVDKISETEIKKTEYPGFLFVPLIY